jgi:glycosyltransferase involved in cell wall biosynthesis
MSVKLFSHVNADSDLIEAWLQYYIRLGVDRFHLIVHGSAKENGRLLDLVTSYPIVIDDMYEGPFDSDQKKMRLDALLARNTEQWVLLVDSDEFVEFPYRDIAETIRMLETADSNLMAAPMLQRLTKDGSLDTPSVIEDPFRMFPLCSATLYREMGMKGDIFKFPLFYCAKGTCVREEGNHHPPLGSEPHSSGALGVTHHFKFRRTISQRLDSMIRSEHTWRHESVLVHDYLESHSNRLPIEGAFLYSREELFRRRLLRKMRESASNPATEDIQSFAQSIDHVSRREKGGSQAASNVKLAGRRIVFFLPKKTEFDDFEKHLVMVIRGLNTSAMHPAIVCVGDETIVHHGVDEVLANVTVQCVREPQSLREWYRLIRGTRADIVVFCYNWFKAFPWQAPLASFFAGVRRRISIQHVVPQPAPPLVEGNSPRERLRRLIGGRARYMFKVRLTGYLSHKTICVSSAVGDALVREYQFPARKTITIHNGVSTAIFSPNLKARAALRASFDVSEEDFLLVCAASLSEARGIDILINAVSRVARQGIVCKCIILGDGALKEHLQKEVNALGLAGYVYFEGSQKDIRPYLQAGSAFIQISKIEWLPFSVLEAMACGLPCITRDVGGSAEAVKDRVTGLIIRSGTLDEVENAILYLATHPLECAEMAAKSRETAYRSFNAETEIKELKAAILDRFGERE